MHDTQAEDTALLAAIEDSAETFLRDRGGLAVARRQRSFEDDALPKEEFEQKEWLEIARLGWTGVFVPAEQGGLGLGMQAAHALAHKMGRWLAPEPYSVIAGVAATLLAGAPSAAARELLDMLISGECIVGMSLDVEGSPRATRRAV